MNRNTYCFSFIKTIGEFWFAYKRKKYPVSRDNDIHALNVGGGLQKANLVWSKQHWCEI